ncbi:NYN domain-containing protein [Nocardioides glacieisoli]|uniref:NYN domain-containing protein n=1 Tax=Nocardioides glacieisoli TaxID=1168730 RepID=A0A4V1RKK0_9ACTN|nr:NYN domain-containing protein [Nocardioides glacieisoli]RYB92552.1 NYN domain-containing protein [Nocardioides glacieisoli]
MDANGSTDRIAVLIDAENTRAAYADEVLSEVAKYGNPTIKRVYGDWTNSHLTPWARRLNSLGLRAMHQNAFTKSKNSSDLALVIDAMDLLYDDNVEAFALVTSDSDFTSLAHRLRESGKTVYVLGENKAPDALKNACDKFIDLEVVQDEKKTDGDELPDGDDETPAPTINLQSALTRALNAVADDEGWATLASLGNQLTRTYPSFDARSFGNSGTRLSTLVTDQPYLETSGSGNAMRVRRKGAVKEAASKAAPKAAAKGEGRSESTSEPQAAKEPRKPRASRARKATKVETTETAGSPAEAPQVEGPKVTTTTRAARKSTKAAAKKA